jgi:WD40 repeat protein
VVEDNTATQTPEQRIDAQLASAPPVVAGYSLQMLCGQGSFGEVWSGTQLSSGQKVALKFFRRRTAAFQAEVERLSLVAEHPHVVKLLDADLNAQPPYFVMQHYPDSLASRARSEVSQVVVWMSQIGQALRHTHRRGLLHCDLKPSNILLNVENQAQLADFGQAVLRQGEGSSLGSLGYMAPEQANPKALPDVRWDVYALGATVYFLLTGHKPRQADNLQAYGSSQTTVVPLRSLNPKVDADLAWLVETCLAWNPERRPDSMDAVLEDLERRRKLQPLLCRRPWQPAYLAGRFLRRHAVASLFLIFLGLAALLLWQQYQKTRLLLAEQDFRLGWTLFDEGEKAEAMLWWADAVGLAPEIESYRWPGRSYPFPLIKVLRHSGELERLAFSPDGQKLLAGGDDGSARLFNLEDGKIVAELPAQSQKAFHDPLYEGNLHTVDFSPDGRSFVAAGNPPRLWQDGTVSELGGSANQAYFAPDGHGIVLTELKTARLVIDGRIIPLPHGESVAGVVFHPDGSSLLTYGGNILRYWQLPDGQPGPVLKQSGAFYRARFDRDGKRLVTGGDDGAKIWRGDQLLLHIPTPEPVMAANFSHDGQKLVLGGGMGKVWIYSAQDGRALMPGWRHRWALVEALFSQDDQEIFTYSYYGTARFWHSSDGKPASPSFLNQGPLKSVAIRPDEQLMATGTMDGSIRVFQLKHESLLKRELALALKASRSVYLSPDGSRLVTSQGIWSTADGQRLGSAFAGARQSQGIPFIDISFSSDGKRLALSGARPRSYEGEKPNAELPEARYFTATLSPQGDRLVTLALDNTIKLWDARTAQELASTSQPVLPVKCAWRPDGRQFAIGSVDAAVRVYDTQAHLISQFEQGMFVSAIAYNPDGTRLAIGSGDGSVRVWDPQSGKPVSVPLHHQAAPVSLVFDPTGKQIACSSLAGEVLVADAESGRLLMPPLHHPGVTAVAFNAQGLLTASGDKLRCWDMTPPARQSPERVQLEAELVTGMQLDGPLKLSEWEQRKSRL